MPKPEKLNELGTSETRLAAKRLFDGETTVSIPGYEVYLPKLDDLPDHVRMFVVKAIGMGEITNVLDLHGVVREVGEENED